MIDRSVVGRELGETRFPIDRSKLRELARSLGDIDPVWHDPASARAAGFDDVPLSPTVTVLADHWREGGPLAVAETLGLDIARLLHGEASWEYLAPIRIGDELTARQHVADVTTREGKRGGAMTLVTLVTDYENQDGQPVARRSDVLIERGA